MNYIVTFHSYSADPDWRPVFAERVRSVARVLAAEYDAGFYIVSSELPASELLAKITLPEFDLQDSVFVIELGNTSAGFGTTQTREALAQSTKASG